MFREEVGLSERVGEEGLQDDTNMHFEYFENSLQGSPVVNAEKFGAIDECAGGGVLSALECAENGAVTEPGNSLQGAYVVKAENSGVTDECVGIGKSVSAGECAENGAVTETGDYSKDDIYFDMESPRVEANVLESVTESACKERRQGSQRVRRTEVERLGGMIVDPTLRSRTVRKP